MHRPPTWRPSRRQPRHDGCLRARLLRPAGVHAMVVAHSLNPPATPSTLGPSRERTANGRAVALATQVHSCDRRKGWAGPRRLGPGVQGSHSVSRHCPRRQLESRVRERKVESSFGAGLDRSQLRPPGTAVVRRTYP